MNIRQATAKTYYDKKRIAGASIQVDDHVLVYDPRLKCLKLHPKWVGPCKVKSVSEYIFEIEFVTAKHGTIYKWIPRDRLKVISKDTTIVNVINEETDSPPKEDIVYSDTDESDEDQQNLVRYNLRPRRHPVNYHVDLF